MWQTIQDNLIVIAVTAFVMWTGGWVRTFLAKRVRVQSPDAETVAKLVPRVNLLIDMKEPEINLLIALGEAAQGQNNGNVTTALTGARGAREEYRKFLGKTACIEVEK
jgi:uracil-DNA glycosylase